MDPTALPADPCVRRNVLLRRALFAAFPGVGFLLRDTPAGQVRITWSDGPTPDEVRAVVNTVPAGAPHRRYAVRTERRLGAELSAVACLRSAAGQPVEAGPLSAAQVDAAERGRARLLLSLAEPLPWDAEALPGHLARVLRRHADLLEAVLSPGAP